MQQGSLKNGILHTLETCLCTVLKNRTKFLVDMEANKTVSLTVLSSKTDTPIETTIDNSTTLSSTTVVSNGRVLAHISDCRAEENAVLFPQ